MGDHQERRPQHRHRLGGSAINQTANVGFGFRRIELVYRKPNPGDPRSPALGARRNESDAVH